LASSLDAAVSSFSHPRSSWFIRARHLTFIRPDIVQAVHADTCGQLVDSFIRGCNTDLKEVLEALRLVCGRMLPEECAAGGSHACWWFEASMCMFAPITCPFRGVPSLTVAIMISTTTLKAPPPPAMEVAAGAVQLAHEKLMGYLNSVDQIKQVRENHERLSTHTALKFASLDGGNVSTAGSAGGTSGGVGMVSEGTLLRLRQETKVISQGVHGRRV